MNQDQVKTNLLLLEPETADFSVIFSGKSSKKAHGLYKFETQEILIHNRNFTDDNALMYTAIHEFAHHVHFCRDRNSRPSERRAHTIAFRNILHKLLERAEEESIYKNIFEANHEFQELTRKIKEQYLAKNGQIMKEFGKLLIEALDLCHRCQASFEDYVERALSLNRSQAKTVMKIYAMDLDHKIGYDNMRIVSAVKDPERRAAVEEMLHEGKSQDETKTFIRESAPAQEETAKRLQAEKNRIEKSLHVLQERLEEVEAKLSRYNMA